MQVWSHETADYRVNERAPIAQWRDDVLRLEFGTILIERAPGEASMTCLFSVRLVYRVSGLVHRAYRVHASPARILNVAP